MRHRKLKLLRTIVLLDLAAGAAGCLLSIPVYRASGAQILAQFERSLVTAFFVGTPAVLLLARFGTRMYRVRAPWKWGLIAAAILGCAAAGTLASSAVSIELGLIPQGHFWIAFWARIQIAAVLALGAGIGAVGYGVLRNQLEASTLEQERAQKLAVEAQLASLESHVRPHFLFNALNTVPRFEPGAAGVARTRAEDCRRLPGNRAGAIWRAAARPHRGAGCASGGAGAGAVAANAGGE
jgi:hypothetical protein